MPDVDLRDLNRVRELNPAQRRQLLRALVNLEARETAPPVVVGRRRRLLMLTAIVVCCLALAAQIGVLAATLPRYYRAGDWRGAWVGFDVALLGVFAVTGWAAWRRRQLLIICLVVVATLLCCDAWFDVVLDARTSGFLVSLLSAVFIELPLATLAILGARRLLHLNIAVIRRYTGEPGPPPGLRRTHLVGHAHGSQLRDLFRDCTHVRADSELLAEQASTEHASTEHASTAQRTEHGFGAPGDGPHVPAPAAPGAGRDDDPPAP